MPLYQTSVTTNAQTGEVDAVTSTVEVEERVIQAGMIFIDPSANGEVEAQLRFGDAQLLPHANGETFQVPAVRNFAPINRQLPGVPTEIELRAWAPDADFQHPVFAQIETVSLENATDKVQLVSVGQSGQGPAVTPTPEDIRQAGTE